MNICEMKFYSDDFSVDRDYYRTLLHRQTVISESISRKYSIQQTLVTSLGLKQNAYSGIFSSVITLDNLFI